MRPAPIPDAIAMTTPGRRIVVGPPGNNLDSDIAPVEAMALTLPQHMEYSVRCVMEDGDREKLDNGEAIWVTFVGSIPPFRVEVAP